MTCTVAECGRITIARGLCSRHYSQWWSKAHPDKIRAAKQRYRASAKGKATTLAHERKPHIRTYRKRYYEQHGKDIYRRRMADPAIHAAELERLRILQRRPDQRARHRKYMEEYKQRPGKRERMLALTRAYQQSPKGMAYHRDWWAQNGKTIDARRKHDPQRQAVIARKSHLRRARKLAVASPADLTSAQWDAIKTAYGYRCAYCGQKPKSLTKDHIKPIALGGALTADNIVPACRSCNARKNAKIVPAQPVLLLV